MSFSKRWKNIIRFSRITGYVMLGLAELLAIIAVWRFLTPLSLETKQYVGDPWPVSILFLAFAIGVAFFILFSVLVSENRICQLSILSLCLGLLVCTAWFRSYRGTEHQWWLSKSDFFPDHYEMDKFSIRTADGGVCFVLERYDDWDNLNEPKFAQREHPWRMRVTRRQNYADTWRYPGFNDTFKVWKGGWLDSIGVRFWAHDTGKRGSPASPSYYSYRGMTLPIWLLLIPCMIFPTIYSTQIIRRWRRIRHGLCQCGYDLRGITSDKCPECGTPVPPRKEIAKAPDAAKPAA